MRKRTPSKSALLATLILFFSMFATMPAAAEPKEWDQAAVTKLAKELANAAGDLRRSVRSTPPSDLLNQRRLRQDALDDLRVVENSVNSLATRLEAGEGREETYPTYRRIQRLRARIARNARLARLTEPTVSKLATARVLLEQLEPYYQAEEAV
jgi:hypothetical protein